MTNSKSFKEQVDACNFCGMQYTKARLFKKNDFTQTQFIKKNELVNILPSCLPGLTTLLWVFYVQLIKYVIIDLKLSDLL